MRAFLFVIICMLLSVISYSQKRDRRVVADYVDCAHAMQDTTTSFEERLNSAFKKYRENTLYEKLYIHTDKDACIVGDTIWFKGYISSAETNLPVDYSRFMYIDLVDRTDSVHYRTKIGRVDTNLFFYGYVPMSENLRQGEYFLRAYTYFQQNRNEAYIYKKRVRVINPFDHQIRSEIKLERILNDGSRIITLSFINDLGETYPNVDFQYCIPSINNANQVITENTGYNGRVRITIKDSLANRIWLKFSLSASWDYEGYEEIPGAKSAYRFQFFPEGGKLIKGNFQRIAYKAVNSDGAGRYVKGGIYDTSGRLISNIESNKLGYGSFYVDTDTVRNVKLIYRGDNGDVQELHFPEAESGVVLSVNAANSNVSYDIKYSSDYVDSLRNSYVVIYSRGILLSVLPALDFEKKRLSFASTQPGVICFALCNDRGTVYSERLWYNRIDGATSIEFNDIDMNVDNGKMDVVFTYNNGLDRKLNCSVSVISLYSGWCDIALGGIKAFQLLTSDLGGVVENSYTYFDESNQEADIDFDNLLITYGWNNFKLNDILQMSTENIDYYMERGQFVGGRVKSLYSKKGQESDVVLIGSNGIFQGLRTDNEGEFIFDNLFFTEGTSFIAQAKNIVKKVELQVYKPQFKKYRVELPYWMLNSDKNFYKQYSRDYVYGNDGKKYNTLGEVSVSTYVRKTDEMIMRDSLERESRKNFLLGYTDVVNYGGYPHLMTTTGSIISAPGASYSLRSNSIFVPGGNNSTGVNYNTGRRGDNIGSNVQYYSGRKKLHDAKTLAKRVDNIVEGDYFHPVSVHNIETYNTIGTHVNLFGVDLSSSKLVLPGQFAGVVDANTSPTMEISWEKQIFVPLAPQTEIKFISPSYKGAEKEQYPLIDDRATRYWNPCLELNNGDTFKFSFPLVRTGDDVTYLFVIEGLTDEGEPIYLFKHLSHS